MSTGVCTQKTDAVGTRQQITNPVEVLLARHGVRAAAAALGFDVHGAGELATAVNGLARNVLEHGGGGWAEWDEVRDAGRVGMKVAFVDNGPGIGDVHVAMALRARHLTDAGTGIGLSGARQLVDEFAIRSTPGTGTRVEIVKWR